MTMRMRSGVVHGARALLLLALSAGVAAAAPARAPASANKALRELACTSCHLETNATKYLYPSFDAFRKAPPPTPTACAQCHVSNHVATRGEKPIGWLPLSGDMIGRIRKFHAYVEAPPIVTRVEIADRTGVRRSLPRFTACGLERFLSAPLPRHGNGRQSMFPVEPGRLRSLLTAFSPELERCEPTAPAQAAIDRGRSLFSERACATCHTGSGVAPRLRLGFPLLGRAYFRARVQQGTGDRASPLWLRDWTAAESTLIAQPSKAVIMPPHPDLGDGDLDALYAYIASDRSDVPPSPPALQTGRIDVPDAIRRALYREVQTRVFDTSCRHCHSPSANDQQLIQSVFGAVPDAAPVELPMTRLAVTPSPTLHSVLSAGPGCSDSPLIARLKARGDEWAGHAKPGAPRGMPLTMPPIDGDALRLVTVWTQVGCPSDHGDLCEPCAASVASSKRSAITR